MNIEGIKEKMFEKIRGSIEVLEQKEKKWQRKFL